MDEIGVQADHAEGPAAPGPSAPNLVVVPDGNVVTLHPRATMAIGMAAMAVLKEAGGSASILEGLLSEVYVRLGIESWSFPDPVGPESIARLLPFEDGGLEVAEAADRLYSEAVFAPLARRLSRLSPSGPTGGTTPPASPPGSTPPTPSAPSSPSGTAGKRSGAPAP